MCQFVQVTSSQDRKQSRNTNGVPFSLSSGHGNRWAKTYWFPGSRLGRETPCESSFSKPWCDCCICSLIRKDKGLYWPQQVISVSVCMEKCAVQGWIPKCSWIFWGLSSHQWTSLRLPSIFRINLCSNPSPQVSMSRNAAGKYYNYAVP